MAVLSATEILELKDTINTMVDVGDAPQRTRPIQAATCG
jgi:hypothetical protein